MLWVLCLNSSIVDLVAEQQCCDAAQGAESMLPSHIEVAYIPFEMGGPQPGLYLFTQAARMMRPVKQNSSQAPELIGSLEQYNMSIWSVPLLPS